MYIEHVGTMTVKNCKTNMVCPTEFKAAGWGNAGKHEVNGKVYQQEGDKKELGSFSGTWSDKIDLKIGSDKSKLWSSNPLPEKHDWQYYFTQFTMNLNHCPAEMKQLLPQSDSRLRPDLRALEENDIELATTEKHRLEEKQRAARKERADNNTEFTPKYFKKIQDPDSKEDYYAYGPTHGMRDYWADRRNKDFKHMEDIY